ncbi:hypothetical protein M3193_08350 [Sporosarcina luteola]|uniref:hypothetical protein n=1 Tax=Sporosarcina luteola TaxID=582850 RepID=UPI00203DFAD0|nr:hypothetical protein [Sporosarcina luteola]MCM3744151.1 hypothetical protein [Sporosarcina luteola]
MFKKAIPFVLISGLVLTACGNRDNVPNNNETPMQDLNRDVTPRVNNGAGPDMDGIDNGTRNNGVNDGIINDDRNGLNNDRINGDMNGDNTTAPNEEVIIDENVTTPNNNRNK